MNTRKPHNKLLFNTNKREGNLFTNCLQIIDDLFIVEVVSFIIMLQISNEERRKVW